MRRQRARTLNVRSDDDEGDDYSSTAVPVARLPLLILKMEMTMPMTTSQITYCYVFSNENDDDIVQKPSVDTCKPSDILQTAAISADLFSEQPAATCSSDLFQDAFDDEIVGHCVDEVLG